MEEPPLEFSPHAFKAMEERSITQQQVRETLRAGNVSPDTKDRLRAVARVNWLWTTVIFVEEQGRTVIITVWDELSPRRTA
jgi:hypothetical protein